MFDKRLRMFVCAAALLATASCGSQSANRGRRGNTNTNSESSAPAIAITVGKSEAREIASAIRATGSLVADETSDVAPKTAGKISNVYANVGQFVSSGNPIAKIDDKDAR